MQFTTVRRPMSLALAGLMFGATAAADRPLDPGLKERVEVRLVVLDVLVLDRKGVPVPDLTAADFDVEVNHRPVALAGFDAFCGESARKPNIVLAFDYQHLDMAQRGQILADARNAIERGAAGGTPVMVAALTGSLRVELPFTNEGERVGAALGHMRDDPTLFAANFPHSNDDGLVRGLTSLFDVAGNPSTPTAIILYSGMEDGPLDEQFLGLAARAAAARCAVYPFHVEALTSGPRPTEGIPARIQFGAGELSATELGRRMYEDDQKEKFSRASGSAGDSWLGDDRPPDCG